jgi:hypothetical protein
MAALVLILGLLFIENDKAFPIKIRKRKVVDLKENVDEDRRVDWLGALLVTGGLALLMFVLGDGTVAPRGWKTGCTLAYSPPTHRVLQLIIFRCHRAPNHIDFDACSIRWMGVLPSGAHGVPTADEARHLDSWEG